MKEDSKLNVVAGGKFGINWQDSTSSKGHNLAEVRSAVIKEIRRGRAESALFWALEMVDAGEQVTHKFWEDLRVFALEDVGLANADALGIVTEAQKLFYDLPENDNRRLLSVAHAVCYLTFSKKTRYANEMLAVILENRKGGENLTIPDYAVDLHTRRGREMGRGLLHYLETAAQLTNEHDAFSDRYRKILLSRVGAKQG